MRSSPARALAGTEKQQPSAARSANMARIRAKNTGIERQLRSELHRRGFRFRLHRRDLAGTPDIVLPSRRVVIFVNGCFWHQHGCHLSTVPQTNREFWLEKFKGTRVRDAKAQAALVGSGWRVLTVWECATRGGTGSTVAQLGERVAQWIDGEATEGSIPRTPERPAC